MLSGFKAAGDCARTGADRQARFRVALAPADALPASLESGAAELLDDVQDLRAGAMLPAGFGRG